MVVDVASGNGATAQLVAGVETGTGGLSEEVVKPVSLSPSVGSLSHCALQRQFTEVLAEVG